MSSEAPARAEVVRDFRHLVLNAAGRLRPSPLGFPGR